METKDRKLWSLKEATWTLVTPLQKMPPSPITHTNQTAVSNIRVSLREKKKDHTKIRVI
jgi:hypothetical protein